jgi:hypothetical protein
MRKTQPAPEPMVRIAEVLGQLSGTDPAIWQAEAEELAAGMPAAVTRDWRGHPCLGWVDAERLYLRMLRDRAEATREQAERLAALEAERRPFLGAGVVGTETPGEADWRGALGRGQGAGLMEYATLGGAGRGTFAGLSAARGSLRASARWLPGRGAWPSSSSWPRSAACGVASRARIACRVRWRWPGSGSWRPPASRSAAGITSGTWPLVPAGSSGPPGMPEAPVSCDLPPGASALPGLSDQGVEQRQPIA